jgi:hypothetical protein
LDTRLNFDIFLVSDILLILNIPQIFCEYGIYSYQLINIQSTSSPILKFLLYWVHLFSPSQPLQCTVVHDRDVGDRWSERTIAHPGFGRSLNPISTRGGRLCPHNYYLPTQLSVASYVPEFNSKSKSAHSKKSFLTNSIVDSQQSNMYAQSFNKHVHAREKKKPYQCKNIFFYVY